MSPTAGTVAAAFEVVSPSLDAQLAELDRESAAKIDDEPSRQRDGLEMTAWENHTAVAVMPAQGSVLTNKYAEGYPGKLIRPGDTIMDLNLAHGGHLTHGMRLSM